MSEHNDEGGDVVQQQENPMEDASRQSIELISISSVEQGLGSAEFDIDKETARQDITEILDQGVASNLLTIEEN